MSDEKTIILPDDPKAARFVENISGWVSRTGLFYGKDERTARYAGCTHAPCNDCGVPVRKGGYTVCPVCLEKRAADRYAAREKRPWLAGVMAYSEVADTYFEYADEAIEHLEEFFEACGGLEQLRLVLCEPVYAREVETDYWHDALPDDGELPAEMLAALETLNDYLREEKFILSWKPGRYAVDLAEATK